MNGDESEGKFKVYHRLINFAKEKVEVMEPNSNFLLRSEYRGYRKIIDVQDNNKIVALLHTLIIPLRDRCEKEFNADYHLYLLLIMAAFMSKMCDI